MYLDLTQKKNQVTVRVADFVIKLSPSDIVSLLLNFVEHVSKCHTKLKLSTANKVYAKSTERWKVNDIHHIPLFIEGAKSGGGKYRFRKEKPTKRLRDGGKIEFK